MDLISQVVGHSETKSRLVANIHRFPSASVFFGHSGIGKFQLAVAMAQKIICPENGCGTCGLCVRVRNHQCEAMKIVKPENLQIKVEAVRDVVKFFALSGTTNRVVIIDDAHRLNVQASNALLKTLEEPPNNCFLILVTDSFYGLLPTIRSRTQVFRFGRLSPEEMKKLYPQTQKTLLAAAQGVPGNVEKFENADWQELREKAASFFVGLFDANTSLSKDLYDSKETALETLELLQQFLRDYGFARNCATIFGDNQSDTSLIHPEVSQKILNISMTDNKIRVLSRKLDEAEKSVFLNVDRRLIFENLIRQI